MKKLILLLCFVSYCLLSNAQELTAPSSTTSGSEVTITASGESDMAYFSSISYDPTLTSTTPSNQQGWISANFIQYEQQYNIVSRQPTKFKMKMTNGFNQAISATFGFRCVQYSTSPGASPVNVVKYLTITVNPAPVQTVFKNASKSQVFTKNDCGAGTTGTQVTYTVPANKYSSTISQADADSKAQNDINNNGQAYANANGQCLTAYYNTETSGSFTKNDCGSGYSGSVVTYVIPARKYQSTVSQLAADQLAINDLNSNGQINANNIGTCSEVRKRYRAALRREGACNSSVESNTFIWIREDYDLNNLGSSLNSIDAYTSQTGETKIIDGSYKIMYSIKNSENPEQGVRIFSVLNGSINGYYLCNE